MAPLPAGRTASRTPQTLARFACFACALVALVLAPVTRAAEDATSSVSLYAFINEQIDPRTGTLSPDAPSLPDESTVRRFSRTRWAPGALEGLGTRHMKWDGSEKAWRAARLLELIAEGKPAAEPALYEMLRADDVVTFYSDALDLAAARISEPEPVLHDLARRLATESADRGPVKFGIAMLGSFADPQDLPIVQKLALHDEFGLYAAEAIAEMAPDRQRALYDMARKVQGWGRIEAVSRMVATHDPMLRTWLLAEGFRNAITPQYLAYQCVTIADLAGALEALEPGSRSDKSDLPLLVGAADLLQALIAPGPAPGFAQYEEAPRAATAFLRHVQKRRDSVSFYLAALAIREYVASLSAEQPADGAGTAQTAPSADDSDASSDSADAQPVQRAHWTPQQQREVAALADRVVSDGSWRRHVLAAMADDDTDLDQAERAARKLGIETFPVHARHLVKRADNARRWELAFAAARPEDVKRLVEIAQNAFSRRFADARVRQPLARPSPEEDPKGVPGAMQPATDWRAGAALEAVLHGVARYPGSGMSLVESSLSDADGRVRRAAVDTLVRWGEPYLRNVSVRAALNQAARNEVDASLRARMVALLNLSSPP